MDKTAPALELRDIHLPADPGLWPLTIGWWMLIIIVGIIAFFVVKKYLELNKQKKINQMLQSELATIRNDFKQHQDKHRFAAGISDLLKRFVRHVLKDSSATSLTGDDWIKYLNSRVDSGVFSHFHTELTKAQYIQGIDFDVPSLMAAVKNYFPKAIKKSKQFNRNKTRNKTRNKSQPQVEKQHA